MGEIPKEWLLANICPLFQKGDKALACNNLPVSLTCVPCKVLEHIVCLNIMVHLDEYQLLSKRQYAFRILKFVSRIENHFRNEKCIYIYIFFFFFFFFFFF